MSFNFFFSIIIRNQRTLGSPGIRFRMLLKELFFLDILHRRTMCIIREHQLEYMLEKDHYRDENGTHRHELKTVKHDKVYHEESDEYL